MILSRRLALTGLAALPSLAWAQDPFVAQTADLRRQFRGTGWLPIDLSRGSIAFEVLVNGHKTTAILDSGAAGIMVDTTLAAQAGIAPADKSISMSGLTAKRKVEISGPLNVKIGAADITYTTALMGDLSLISAANGAPIGLILGSPLFEAGLVDIDFNAGRLNIEHWGIAKPNAGSISVPLVDMTDGGKRIQIAIEGHPPIWAQLDFGNNACLALSADYAQRIALLQGRRTSRWIAAGIEGLYTYDVATLDHVTLEGVSVHAVPVDLVSPWANKDADANIGLDLVRQLGRVMVDYPGNQLLLTPSALRPAPFERDRSGVALKPESGGQYSAILVAPDSPAARAGWKVGERVVAADGKPVDRNATRKPAGTVVRFTMADGSERTLTLADYY